MAKTLTLKYDGQTYVLEYTRSSVQTMEKQGFRSNAISETPLTQLPLMFSGAFLAHHAQTSSQTINDIFAHLSNKTELFGKLAEMYGETIETLLGDPEESEGNAVWGADW